MGEVVIFDKDSYHYSGDFPRDLNKESAGKHIGFYLKWMRERNLLNEDGVDLAGDDYLEIEAARLCRRFDGVLTSEVMSNDGKLFSGSYYKSQYAEDYAGIFAELPGTIYHVSDTKNNYMLLTEMLDARYRLYRKVDL